MEHVINLLDRLGLPPGTILCLAIIVIAGYIALKQLASQLRCAIDNLTNEIKGIRVDLKEYQTIDRCDERHGHSCKRLDDLEKRVDRNSEDLSFVRAKVK